MDEPPPDSVIENDEALDSFLRARRMKREAEERKARLQSAKTSSSSGKRKHERII